MRVPTALASCARQALACTLAAALVSHSPALPFVHPYTPAAAAAATLGDCTEDGAPCRRVDFGTCGNACCTLDYETRESPEAIADRLAKSLRKGGPDGQYALTPLASGQTGFTDLRQFDVPAHFLGQAKHTTARKGYSDTVNLAVFPAIDNGAKVRVFSVSDIGGALSDRGQNHRNIETLMNGVGLKVETARLVFGCGQEPCRLKVTY